MAATYAYKAIDASGTMQTGLVSADAPEMVAERIRRMGLRPVVVEEHRVSVLKRELHLPGARDKVKPAEVAALSRQLATMVASGLPLLRCLTALQKQTDNPALLKALEQIRGDISSGDQLSVALVKFPKLFDELYVSMVRAGESSGQLDIVLAQLADTVERSAKLRRKVKSAMTYPVAIAGLCGVIVTAMLLFLVPTFQRIFADLKGELPLPTRIVIGASDFVRGYVLYIVVVVLGAIVGAQRWKATPAGRLAVDRLKLRVPIFGKMGQKTATSRFARSFAVLLRSGVPILDGMDIARKTVQNRVIVDAIGRAAEGVRSGQELGRALSEQTIFDPMVLQMIEAGEESGQLDHMLDKVAEFYESEVEAAVVAFTSLIEPMLLVFMGVTVGGMVISLYLPMFKVISLVK